MRDNYYVPFTKEMKKTHTILIPDMLPMHFKLMAQVFRNFGYRAELLETTGRRIAQTGLKYVHNDTCYPAILMIGQFIDAIQSGKYDVHKVALVMFQTGGGCRASNYISLIRKALDKAGYGFVPVISMSFAGIEKHPGFRMSIPMIRRMMYGVLYADLLMSLSNQCLPYEENAGETRRLSEEWVEKLRLTMEKNSRIRYADVKENYRKIIADFAALPKRKEKKVKVGVVGEIFVKYSPLGNNHLNDFLVKEGAEVTVPGFLDFCLFVAANGVNDRKLYGGHFFKALLYGAVRRLLLAKQKDMIAILKETAVFEAPTPFDHTEKLIKGYISEGVKMGEGWLLTAEMLELSEEGVKNIICTQPFGCLPNHICGKGMMKRIKAKNPDVNIVAIDYDAGMSVVNQENRIKLMLANAAPALLEEAPDGVPSEGEKPEEAASQGTAGKEFSYAAN